MRQPRPFPSRGFTLIELLVSLAVLVIVLSLAAPSFQKAIAAQRVKNASFDLFSALNYARSEAVTRNGSISLRAGASTNGAWNTGWRIDDGTTILRSWAATKNLTVTEQTGGATTVTYGRDGRLTTTTAPKLEVRPTVTLSGVNARCVQVDLSGRPTTHSGACP
jgi:type IV fimbrial biogenesis protein FimT